MKARDSLTFTKRIYHMRQGKRTREGARERDKHKEPEISLKTKIQCGFMPYSESSVTKFPDDKRSVIEVLPISYVPFILYTVNK